MTRHREFPVLFVDVVNFAAPAKSPSRDISRFDPWSSAETPNEAFWSMVLNPIKANDVAGVWIVVAERRRGPDGGVQPVRPGAMTLNKVTLALRAWLRPEPARITR